MYRPLYPFNYVLRDSHILTINLAHNSASEFQPITMQKRSPTDETGLRYYTVKPFDENPMLYCFDVSWDLLDVLRPMKYGYVNPINIVIKWLV